MSQAAVWLTVSQAFDRVFHDFSKFSPGFNVKTFLTLKNVSGAGVPTHAEGLTRS